MYDVRDQNVYMNLHLISKCLLQGEPVKLLELLVCLAQRMQMYVFLIKWKPIADVCMMMMMMVIKAVM